MRWTRHLGIRGAGGLAAGFLGQQKTEGKEKNEGEKSAAEQP
jgi:hypothetical protein